MFSKAIIIQNSSDSMIIRRLAFQLSDMFKIERKISQVKELSPIYYFDLPKTKIHNEPLFDRLVAVGEPLPDIKDAFEIMSLYHSAFKLLSKLTHISVNNLIYKAYLLMEKISPLSCWDRSAEEQILFNLRSTNFKIAYRRPRLHIAQIVLSYVIAELFDADKLSEQDLILFERWLIFQDFFLLKREPVKKPNEITTPPEFKDDSHGKWIQEEDQKISMVCKTISTNKYVIAELSCFIEQAWRSPTEYRLSQICHPDWIMPASSPNHLWNFFVTDNFPIPNRYPYNAISDKDLVLSVYAIPWTSEHYLAFNPVIADIMDWTYQKEGLFRWSDKNGHMMVESIMWQDGCTYYNEPHGGREICSHGWLIVASEKGWNQLKKKIKPADRLCCVIRTKLDDRNKKMTNSWIARVKLW